MKLKEKTIEDLKTILKEEYNLELNSKEAEKFAYSLLGYFNLLNKNYYKN